MFGVHTTAPAGDLTDGDRHARRFSGRIELAAIEDWRTGAAQADSRPPAIEAPD